MYLVCSSICSMHSSTVNSSRDADFARLRKMDRICGINGLKRNSPFSNGNSAIVENRQNPWNQLFKLNLY